LWNFGRLAAMLRQLRREYAVAIYQVNASETYSNGVWNIDPNSTVTGPSNPQPTTAFPQWIYTFYNN
jgi:hypothetical protein